MVNVNSSVMQVLMSLLAFIVLSDAQRLAGECAGICNDLRTEVLTMEMCRFIPPVFYSIASFNII